MPRFAAAAGDGFTAVEFLFPYEYPAAELGALLQRHHLTQALGGERAQIKAVQLGTQDMVNSSNGRTVFLQKRAPSAFLRSPRAASSPRPPLPDLTWYNGSKGAVITTSKSLAAELGADNIRVNCVNPVMNPSTRLSSSFAGGELTEERLARFRATIRLGRFSTALDVGNEVLYLVSDEAAFISGVCIEVDGARCV